MSISTSATPLSPNEKLQQTIANPNASRATSGLASIRPATPEAAAAAAGQAQQGAAQAQPQAEPFNAPFLRLRSASPTSHEVMNGLTSAMADPTVNSTTAAGLYKLHDMVLNAERGMIQAVIDGMLV